MTLTQLNYMTAVAEFGNFTLAAEKCFVTQPTLSMQIQKLESVRPTPAGAYFASRPRRCRLVPQHSHPRFE